VWTRTESRGVLRYLDAVTIVQFFAGVGALVSQVAVLYAFAGEQGPLKDFGDSHPVLGVALWFALAFGLGFAFLQLM